MPNTENKSFGSNVGLIIRIHQFKEKSQCHVHYIRVNTQGLSPLRPQDRFYLWIKKRLANKTGLDPAPSHSGFEMFIIPCSDHKLIVSIVKILEPF